MTTMQAATPWMGNGNDLDALLAALDLSGFPNMDGAACVGHHQTFDEAANEAPGAMAQAVRICAGCPIIARCRDYRASLPKALREGTFMAGIAPTKRIMRSEPQRRRSDGPKRGPDGLGRPKPSRREGDWLRRRPGTLRGQGFGSCGRLDGLHGQRLSRRHREGPLLRPACRGNHLP